ncbi:MAG TPA: hypothetical protein VIN59_07325, partial [Alphaproteobacteria bacterium]
PGGQRHIDKLMANAHTKRIIGAMMAMKKPIVAFADGMRLLAENEFSGDNINALQYADAGELTTAANDMVVYFENNMPSQDEEDEQQAA